MDNAESSQLSIKLKKHKKYWWSPQEARCNLRVQGSRLDDCKRIQSESTGFKFYEEEAKVP